MAVTYVDGDNSTSLNVTDITGLAWPVHAAEDLALFIGAIVDTATATIDAAFTAERNDIDGSLESILARRLPAVMTGSESGAITMSTGATANRMSAAIGIYRSAAAIATIAYQNETGAATTSHVSPTITISSSASALVLLYAERVTSAATPITPPTGFTKRIEWATGGSGGTAVMICDKLTGNSAGSFTPGNVVATTAASAVGMYLVELTATASDVPLNFGLATEADSALSLTASKTSTYGQPAETDSALGASFAKTITFGLATEADTAAAASFTSANTLQFGLATETDTAFAMTWAKATTWGQATETDTAPGWAPAKITQLGLATETDTVLAASLTKTIPYGLATETDTVLALVASKSIGLGIATETDTSAAMSFSGPYTPALVAVATTRAVDGTATGRDVSSTAITRDNTATATTREQA